MGLKNDNNSKNEYILELICINCTYRFLINSEPEIDGPPLKMEI